MRFRNVELPLNCTTLNPEGHTLESSRCENLKSNLRAVKCCNLFVLESLFFKLPFPHMNINIIFTKRLYAT
jgi:hypothetical protein